MLSGNIPLPISGVVLGGIEGVKRRLANSQIEARIAAIKDALNYGERGLELVIQALKDESRPLQRCAYQLLRDRTEPQVKQVIKAYKPWNLTERFQTYSGYNYTHVSTFANRRVREFNAQIAEFGIPDPTIYALRCNFEELELLLQIAESINVENFSIEALIIGGKSRYDNDFGSSFVVNTLLTAKNRLRNLKALFIGDMHIGEWEISRIQQSNISPILEAFPNLKILQVRGGRDLEFTPVRHESLKALIIETGGLSRETIADIYTLELPTLEHLELWLGSAVYGGNSSIQDLSKIFSSQLFPHLIYLGLRNSEYTDAIALALVKSLVLENIRILDLSMGTLTDGGLQVLLNYSAIRHLDILNVSENFLTYNPIDKKLLPPIYSLFYQPNIPGLWENVLDKPVRVQLIANNQKRERKNDYSEDYLFDEDDEGTVTIAFIATVLSLYKI
ncbi:MAG: HEAT repeat domain-containing protein [Hydrococcus sp. RM1_1_31]|nr:HEAT repeat domain-containing protein [Hydrococcus sp. RM1_1_31]